MPPTPLVVFDLGGVLVRLRGSWAEACAAAGVPFRGGEAPWWGVPGLVLALDSGAFVDDAAFFRAAAEASGGAYSAEDVARGHAAWVIGEFQGVGALLDAIEARGAAETGILSNTNESHWKRMLSPEFPSLSRVRHPHASYLLGAAKPSPAVFERFRAAVARSPGDILFFDDRPENVKAAQAAGWRAVHVPPVNDPPGFIRERLAGEGLA